MSTGLNINYVATLLSNTTEQDSSYTASTGNATQSPALFGAITSSDTDTGNKKVTSLFGTEVVNPITFKGGKYKVYDQKGNLSDLSVADFMLPATSVADFSRKKTINKTTTIGGQGTVKEIYSIDEWEITITGTCLTDSNRTDHQTAYEQQLALDQFNRVAGNINVSGGNPFNDKDIAAITIDDMQFKTKPGSPYEVQFEIKATSDNPVELDS